MQGKWLCHTLGLAQKTQPDRFGFWSADLPFSGKTESQSVAAVKQLEKKKHFSAAFFLAFRPFWMKRHLHSTAHTHTHTAPCCELQRWNECHKNEHRGRPPPREDAN